MPSTIPPDEVRRLVDCFDLADPINVCDFPGKGNIHRHTFLVTSGRPDRPSEYLLQMLNTDVFHHPDRVMDIMTACIGVQEKSLRSLDLPKDISWEPVRLIPTRKGKFYLETEDSDARRFWRMMVRIPHSVSYQSLDEISSPAERYRIAEEAGKGLALFHRLTAEMNTRGFSAPLPGYRNTELYYAQLNSILHGSRTLAQAENFLPSDSWLRQNTGPHFLVRLKHADHRQRMERKDVRELVTLALDNRTFGLSLQKKLAIGDLKTTIVHGDTKLDNFLFDSRSGKVKSLVDLDTVMAHSWLTDWGDMVRSLINIEGEKRSGSADIEIDMQTFKSIARGFIGSAAQLPQPETALMVDAARIMALELGVRYLTDYVRGDTYFKVESPAPQDLNRIRASVQFSIFQALGNRSEEAEKYIETLCSKLRNHRTVDP